MYKKKIIRPLVMLLIASQCITSFAGTWVGRTSTEWVYELDDGTYQKSGWFVDPATGKRYYLDENGVMGYGWKLLEGSWYFLNTVHDGSFGAVLSNQWSWIDGYCYLFGPDGKLFTDTVTPDGFSVNKDGQWTENSTVVFMAGKGIHTGILSGKDLAAPTAGKKSPGGGSSGGGGGGGGGSASYTYYDYTVTYVDEDGVILSSFDGEARKNSFITIPVKEFEGYTFVDGPSGSQKLISDQMTFVMHYKKTVSDVDPETPDEKETYSYTVTYMDEDGTVIKKVQGTGESGAVITANKTLDGYTASADNSYTFTLSENHMEITLYYTKEKEEFHYKINYTGDDGVRLGSIDGSAAEGSRIEIPERHFEGYSMESGQEDAFTLNSNGQVVKVLFIKDITEEEGTPSEPEEKSYSYTVKYIDKDSMKQISKESGTGLKGDIIIPDLKFEGYEYASDYEFTVKEDGDEFIVYLIKEKSEAEEKEVPYTVVCVDEDGNKIKAFDGTVTVTDGPVAIYPDYEIKGYERTGSNEFYVSADGDNSFILEYTSVKEEKEYTFTVKCVDIDTLNMIDEVLLYGNAGEELDISDICPAGYETVGVPPETVKVSANEKNNTVQIYFKKTADIPDTGKEAEYTVEFRAYKDHSTQILNDLTGTWTVGEKIPVYFLSEVTDSEGTKWQAVGDSPRIFTVRDQEMNTFRIEYQRAGSEEDGKNERIYSIRYVAEDTGSILGITTGIGMVGDTVPYRNSFKDYGFSDDTDAYIITSEEENEEDVIMKRVNFPGHKPDDTTGLYDGFEWTALFVDSNGEQLFPNVQGFTVNGDELYIDYPDTIEKEEVTYRAAEKSPYKIVSSGSVYQQIIIEYATGDPSENKLEEWKDKAQEKKDEFYGTTPYSYYIAYMEKNSWNDIGLKFGVANAGSEIEVECEEIDGWKIPSENIGNFTLSKDGTKTSAQYERLNEGTSAGYNKRSYSIEFVDQEGAELFGTYTGSLAFIKGNSTCDFTVYYPDSFYDAKGNRWEADEASPQTFEMSALDKNEKSVSYHQVYENEKEQFIVERNADVNGILNDFATHTHDAGRHEFYLIGRDYNPETAEVSDTMYANNLAGYTNEVVDSFVLNGVEYTVCLVGYYRKWEQGTCSHEWEYTEELEGNCLTAKTQVIQCVKCKKEVTVIQPAVGHIDENYDSKCDVCGVMLKQNLGDEITVTWNSGSLGFGTQNYNFICVDTDYKGSGKMLYLCADDISPDIYGGYTEADSADYGSSSLRYFLDDKFADGLSVNTSLQSIEGDAASMLTKEEYDAYKDASINSFPFPSGTFLTKSDDMDAVTLTDGRKITKEEAADYPVRPVILMNRSEEEEGTRTGTWQEGDMQAREIDGKIYLFRCVDANYTDKSNTDKSLALFLCDSVIPANEGLGFDEADGTQSTRFFGNNNNYKYSTINEWLTENKSKTGNLVVTNIGIINEYTGATETGKFQSLDVRSLTRFTRGNAQVMYSNLFIPSVEEAISMKDYLWKFNGSEKNNASEMINNYCESYWLRTPQHGTDNMIYTVNLKTGVIEPKSVSATDGNDISNVGIRPMYIVEQAY